MGLGDLSAGWSSNPGRRLRHMPASGEEYELDREIDVLVAGVQFIGRIQEFTASSWAVPLTTAVRAVIMHGS